MNKVEKKGNVLKRLMPYASQKKYMLYLSMTLSAISGVLLLMPMIFIHNIVRVIILNSHVDLFLIKQDVFYAAIFPMLGLLLYILAGLFSHFFAFEVEENIIKVNIEKIMNKPLGYFQKQESGKLRNVIVGGAAETHTILAHQLPDIASTIVSPIVILILLFTFDWRLGVASIVPVIVGMLFMSTMMTPKAMADRDEYYENLNNLSSEAVEYVRGIPVVKTFGQSVESFKRLHDSILKMKESVLRMTLGWRNKMSLFEAISSSVAFFLVPIAIILISEGENTYKIVADSVIYLLIGPIFGVLIMRSATISQYLYFAQQALDKIETIVDYPDMEFGNKEPDDGGIEFKNVSFSYGNESEKVLHNVSLKINKGEIAAFVGKSGSGKTTIAKLAARFYDVGEGEVFIGTHNIKQYDKISLMNQMAFVFQNPQLFKTSLRENILVGKSSASQEEIDDAINKVGSTEIIDKLEDGLDTIYGSKGTYFSGGEMQRLALARVFLKDAKYIILDEATAFADPENEHIIQESFRKISKGKTTLMIAHRLSTVVDVDKIFVVENGRIVEEGNHRELLEMNGFYKKLWDEYRRSVDWKIGGEHD